MTFNNSTYTTSTLSIDARLYKGLDSGFRVFHLFVTAFTVCGSISCTLLNLFLIYCLLTIDEFKSLLFFPIGLQAAVDALGPGVSNMIYSLVSHFRMRKEFLDYGTSYLEYNNMAFYYFESTVMLIGETGCVLTFFRSILNEFSTGLCVLASAFIRYCLICHPTREIFTRKVKRAFSIALVVAILILVLANMADMSINYRPVVVDTGHYLEDYYNTTFDLLVENCSQFTRRNNKENLRLLWDVAVCLVVPAIPTGFFYLQIFKVLLGRDRDQGRNRELVIAMFLNWLTWVICWSIYYSIMTLAVSYEHDEILASDKNLFYTLSERVVLIRDQICLLYSQLNPFFFIIILKPFQSKVKSIYNLIFRSHDSGFGLLEKNKKMKNPVKNVPGRAANQSSHGSDTQNRKQLRTKADYKNYFRNSILIIAVLIIVFSSLAISFELMQQSELDSLTEQNNDNQRELRNPAKGPNFNLLNMRNALWNQFSDPRVTCNSQHGTFSFSFKRCFIWTRHSDEKRSLTEQVQHCESLNSTLVYPRSPEEAKFIFRYHLSMCGSHCFENEIMNNAKGVVVRFGIVSNQGCSKCSFSF